MQWPIPPFPTKVFTNADVNVTSGGANTKGSWTTLATGHTASGAWVELRSRTDPLSGSDTSSLLDLGIGGAGSETVVVENLLVGNRVANRGTLFPLHVPAGSTVRGRLSSITASRTLSLGLDVFGGEPDSGLSTPGRVAAYGTTLASSSGVTLTPSGTASVKGSYAQLVAATTAPIHALMVMAQGSGSSLVTAEYDVDIAVGGSGSETVVLPNRHFATTPADTVFAAGSEFCPVSLSIPAGVRLAARCSADTTTSTPLEVAVYGFTY